MSVSVYVSLPVSRFLRASLPFSFYPLRFFVLPAPIQSGSAVNDRRLGSRRECERERLARERERRGRPRSVCHTAGQSFGRAVGRTRELRGIYSDGETTSQPEVFSQNHQVVGGVFLIVF